MAKTMNDAPFNPVSNLKTYFDAAMAKTLQESQLSQKHSDERVTRVREGKQNANVPSLSVQVLETSYDTRCRHGVGRLMRVRPF